MIIPLIYLILMLQGWKKDLKEWREILQGKGERVSSSVLCAAA